MLVEVLPYVLVVVTLVVVAVVLFVLRRRPGQTEVTSPGMRIRHIDRPPPRRPTEGTAVDETDMRSSVIRSTRLSRLHVFGTRMRKSQIIVDDEPSGRS